MNVGFFVRHFTERGTEVAIYDYARYNEELLNNKSFIICYTEEQSYTGAFASRVSYDKFASRFTIIEIESIESMKDVIDVYNLKFFYTLTHGGADMYKFDNKQIWGGCKTIKHCVFNTAHSEGDFYISIANCLNKANNTDVPVIGHIVDLPDYNGDMRAILGIPQNAIVLGRYGGKTEFDIPFVHDAIRESLDLVPDLYLLFMNTAQFYEHPRIIYLDKNLDLKYKVEFINTCDAMIHARNMGETFGLSIAEFSSKNKPIITCRSGDDEHIRILGDKGIIYGSKEALIKIFNDIGSIIKSRTDWNAYRSYSPENVMNQFKTFIFDTV